MDLFNKYLLNSRLKTQKRFLFFGLLNFISTQIILAFLLPFFPIYISTFISQVANISIGYYLYSKFVFSFRNKSSIKNVFLYISYAILVWLVNWFLIYFMYHYFEINKNISAIIILPFLVLLSYLIQKNIIFKK